MRIGKRVIILFLFVLLLGFSLSACTYSFEVSEEESEEEWAKKWGSFTPYKTYSYDNKYYAVQTVDEEGPWPVIVVSVYDAETDEFVANFCPARSWDFWGICWESDSYNIWTQSADIGIYCYIYQDGQWIRDENAERPEDIVSKYDKK